MNIFCGQEAADLFRNFHETISKESDRGAVLVAAALLDSGLESALKKQLVLPSESRDPLFDKGHSSSLSFSSKIELAFRLGLITRSTKQMLNIFRKIRNEFAHDVEISLFSEEKTKNRLMEIFKVHSELYLSIICIMKTEFENFIDFELIGDTFEDFISKKEGVRVLFDFFFACTAMAVHRLHFIMKRYDELV